MFAFDCRPSIAWSLWLGLTLAAGVAGAQGPQKPQTTESETTTVTSERMTVQNKQRRAVFEGKVVLTKGELVVHSDLMVVFYEPRESEKDGSRRTDVEEGGDEQVSQMAVSKIVATGKTKRVKIERQAGTATCREAVFYQKEQKIVLTGDPVAWERGNRVTGDRIIMYLDQDRTVVDGRSKVILE